MNKKDALQFITELFESNRQLSMENAALKSEVASLRINQQLKAEIAALVTETSDFTKFGSNCEIVQYLHSKMRQLSAV